MDRSGTFAADWIGQLSKTLAAGAAQRLRERNPELVEDQGDRGFPDVLADTQVRLDFLGQALAAGRPELLAEHLAWLKISYAEQGLSLGRVHDRPAASKPSRVRARVTTFSHSGGT